MEVWVRAHSLGKEPELTDRWTASAPGGLEAGKHKQGAALMSASGTDGKVKDVWARGTGRQRSRQRGLWWGCC